jgi:UDP-4-amino-4-deoxy-L-arabinose formyltransferase/UDP-glucuronic acid dehydrogenase (UDP-4-keto-hexauronic acid decarboxylating)
MKIVIIGRTEILYKTTELLLKNGYEIPVIITAKEAPEYTKTAKDFEELAKKIGAKFLYAPKFTDKEIEVLKKLVIVESVGDKWIGVSMNYTGVIQQEVIDIFDLGILNAHGGDLPKYKGNACQAWAILNGEDKVGLCIHKMVGGELDSGDIIERDYFSININTKITEVLKWMEQKIPHMFLSAINKLSADSNYILEKQSTDPKDALRCYPRVPEDGRIDWKDSNKKILRLINASNKPYAGAYCFYKDKKLTIWDAELYEDNENYCAIEGQIAEIKDDGSIVVITGKGKLKVNKIEYDNYIGKPSKKIRSIRKRLK